MWKCSILTLLKLNNIANLPLIEYTTRTDPCTLGKIGLQCVKSLQRTTNRQSQKVDPTQLVFDKLFGDRGADRFQKSGCLFSIPPSLSPSIHFIQPSLLPIFLPSGPSLSHYSCFPPFLSTSFPPFFSLHLTTPACSSVRFLWDPSPWNKIGARERAVSYPKGYG